MSVMMQAMMHAIDRSCAIKADIVALDEREGGVRATLNLGHTFGHAIEAAQGYGELCVVSLSQAPCQSVKQQLVVSTTTLSCPGRKAE